jgi:5-methylthioadenosine/S-adenosylhomocysteine deaminase
VSVTVSARVLITEPGSPPLRNAVLELSGGRVAALREAAPVREGPVYDVVLPGLIDAHSHGRALPLAAYGIGRGPLERFLIEARELTPAPPEDEALAAADAALATGITATQVLCHDFGDAMSYARRARANAAGYARAGIRVFVALGLTDQDEYIPAGAGRDLLEVQDLVPSRGVTPGSFPGLASSLLGDHGLACIDAAGPVAPQWCSDQALAAIAAAGSRRVHGHLLESARQRLAGDQVARLERAGLLTAASSFAHGIWLDEGQIRRIADAEAVVVHCPGSNTRLGTGICPVRRLLSAGVPVALGLDSNGAAGQADMFAEMRAALRTAEAAGKPLTAGEVLVMATTGGARALARPELGSLRPGAAADAVALELPGASEAADPVGYLVEHASRESVAAVWVAGRRAVPTQAAARARKRIIAAVAEDAPARAARIARAHAAWQMAERAWQAAEQHVPGALVAGRRRR